MDQASSVRRLRGERPVLRLAGAALLAVTAGIHLDLYLTGYRTIAAIGWLFLIQVIVAASLAAAVAITGHRLAAAIGAGFAVATLGGYVLAVRPGLFGFREVRTTAGIVAAAAEVAAFAVLASLALLPRRTGFDSGPGERLARPIRRVLGGERGTGAVIGGVSLAAVLLLAIAMAAAGRPAGTSDGRARSTDVIKVTQVHGASVLTNAKGFTLYWFGPDSPAKSVCTGSCAAYWPPVKVPASAGPGVTGTITTITRADGTRQAAYDGHPLYTYVGDSAPGQTAGNGLNLNGGLWHEVTVGG